MDQVDGEVGQVEAVAIDGTYLHLKGKDASPVVPDHHLLNKSEILIFFNEMP